MGGRLYPNADDNFCDPDGYVAALGMVTAYTLYGYIHILLVIAVAVLLIRLIQGRRVL